ncbi:MFS transporter [Pseudoclavibacter chungangensis]|uniref:MFS transporter n=1 Tax=Pseudoclavibacter chungangensis TaxID=587635 RepID=A0A7J5BPF9_9MICO|nr:MFS transporter [Pseudoclavibacter chungangensis]KAB1654810.1 MFS transporter [Pseudoclavibacter chungangensis]NYJ68070.1 MHS family proline/betaine transporter-like MFS transporter [Pseudoclavibacter chungangensis]
MTDEPIQRTADDAGRPGRQRRLEVDDVIVVNPKSIRKAIGGTVVGNFMEWYDFGIYGYLAVTMTTVFTEGMDERMGLLVTLFGFAVSFLVRPIGGLVLGPLGDRLGRQRVLFFTMALMAISTALIGLLPTAAQMGLWVIVPLYLLKMLQGFSTGGEFAGASTYVAEFSPDRARGFWSSLLQVGSYLGFAAGAATVAITTWITTSLAGDNAMLDFGWRIPFLLAIPLGIVAIWFRARIPETPSFEASEAANADSKDEVEDAAARARRDDDPLARHGILGVLRHHWRSVLIGIAIVSAELTVAYALTSYMPTYLEKEVGLSTLDAAIATVPVLIVMSLLLPFIGRLSDRIGRKPVYTIAVVSSLVLLVPAFAIMQIGQEWAVFIALAMVAIPTAFYVSLTASALPALFPTASRFTGMGITYNLAASLFGGTTPLFSQGLIELTGNTFMPAFYIMLFAALAGVALMFMPESGKRPLIGSLPTVTTSSEAEDLVRGQDTNEFLDTSTMPLVTRRDS